MYKFIALIQLIIFIFIISRFIKKHGLVFLVDQVKIMFILWFITLILYDFQFSTLYNPTVTINLIVILMLFSFLVLSRFIHLEEDDIKTMFKDLEEDKSYKLYRAISNIIFVVGATVFFYNAYKYGLRILEENKIDKQQIDHYAGYIVYMLALSAEIKYILYRNYKKIIDLIILIGSIVVLGLTLNRGPIAFLFVTIGLYEIFRFITIKEKISKKKTYIIYGSFIFAIIVFVAFFGYIDEYGVKQSITVPAANVTKDATNDKMINIKLEDNQVTPVALPENITYTVEFAKGYFTDNFANDSNKFEVKFVNSGSSATTKLKTTTIAEKSSTPGVIEVKFDSAVNPETAKNRVNYSVEGSTVTKATLVTNTPGSGATVELKLADNSVRVTGNYNVTVKGVKGYYGNIVEMSQTTENVVLTENVRPEVTKVTVDKFDSSAPSTTLTLTFSEEVLNATATADTDYELYIDGKKSTATTTVTAISGTASKTATVTINANLASDIAAGKSITLKYVDTNDIVDTNGNGVVVDTITVN